MVLNTDDKDGAEQASAAAFVRVPYGAQGDQRFVIIGLVAPLKKTCSARAGHWVSASSRSPCCSSC
ncbi:hypothetical protein ACFS07_24010 [Undibacterium arcticum]